MDALNFIAAVLFVFALLFLAAPIVMEVQGFIERKKEARKGTSRRRIDSDGRDT